MSSGAQVIYAEHIDQINAALLRLLKKAEAKCALLVDKDGHLVTRQGFTQSLDTTALSALLAGSFASTREIARPVGEPEFSVLFHQGQKDQVKDKPESALYSGGTLGCCNRQISQYHPHMNGAHY